MRFACRNCAKAYNLADGKIAGKQNVKLKCRVCGAIVEIKRQGTVVAQLLPTDGLRERLSEAPPPYLASQPPSAAPPSSAPRAEAGLLKPSSTPKASGEVGAPGSEPESKGEPAVGVGAAKAESALAGPLPAPPTAPSAEAVAARPTAPAATPAKDTPPPAPRVSPAEPGSPAPLSSAQGATEQAPAGQPAPDASGPSSSERPTASKGPTAAQPEPAPGAAARVRPEPGLDADAGAQARAVVAGGFQFSDSAPARMAEPASRPLLLRAWAYVVAAFVTGVCLTLVVLGLVLRWWAGSGAA